MDTIILRDLATQARAGLDCWGRDRPQPVLVTAVISADVMQAGLSDSAEHLSVNYSAVGKQILRFIDSRNFESLYELAIELAKSITNLHNNDLKLTVSAPKQLLCADGLEVYLSRPGAQGQIVATDMISIKDLQANLVLGINTAERLIKQRVKIGISFHISSKSVSSTNLNYSDLIPPILDFVERSNRFTLEALASGIALEVYRLGLASPKLLDVAHIDSITVRAEKPSGTTAGVSTGIEITRIKRWLEENTISRA